MWTVLSKSLLIPAVSLFFKIVSSYLGRVQRKKIVNKWEKWERAGGSRNQKDTIGII